MTEFGPKTPPNPAKSANGLAVLADLAPAPSSGRDATGRFLSGNIGGGRPKGSRNRLSDVLLSVVVNDFIEHGPDAIAKVRKDDPASYLRFIGSLVPRELILQREQEPTIDYNDLTDEEVTELMKRNNRAKSIENALK